MCIGFVACNNYDTNSQGEETIVYKKSIENYLYDEPEFSFGKIKVLTENFIYGNPTTIDAYPDRYDIVLENDNCFDLTVMALQNVYNTCVQTNEQSVTEDMSYNFADHLCGNQMVFAFPWIDSYDPGDELLEIYGQFYGYEKGEYVLNKNIWEYGDMVHEAYQVGEYFCVYGSYLGIDANGFWYNNFESKSNNDVRYFVASFYTMIYREGWQKMIVVESLVVFIDTTESLAKDDSWNFYLNKVVDEYMSKEDRHQIASYYQPIHREIITSWLESDGGKKYVAENMDKYIEV